MSHLKNIRTIAVFRALQLGDLLCAVPAFRALRKHFPDAHITLIGLPWAENFVRRFDAYFDDFIHFPGAEGLPEQGYDKQELEAFAAAMHRKNFDLLLQMQGNGSIVNEILAQWEPRILAGFRKDAAAHPFFLQYPDYGSEIHRHLQLLGHLGIPSDGDDLEFPLFDADIAALNALNIPKNYVIIHPGSRGAWRQWPIRYFAACARHCQKEGYAIVITGTRDERHITAALVNEIDAEVIDLTGKTSLGAVANLVKNASLLIANCTGVSHIASATRTRSVIISMDGEPERWAPLNKELHRVIDWTKENNFDLVHAAVAASIAAAGRPEKKGDVCARC